MPDFGFVGSAYTAPSIYQDAQECINWYPEIDPTKADSAIYQQLGEQRTRGVVALYPTPGLIPLVTSMNSAPVRALWTLSGGNFLLAVVGANVYSIDPTFTATQVGTLNTFTGPVSINDNSLQAMLTDGIYRYSYVISTKTLTVIPASDGAFNGADVVDVVDNYFIYNRPGTQQFAASTALSTSTPALSFSSKDGSPDNLVSIIVSNREVYLLGEVTTEVWIDTGAFPFPLSRIPGTSSQSGIAAKFSVARLGHSFAWLSQNRRGQAMVMVMNGYQPTRISTHAVENDLLGQVINDAIAYTYQMEGHEFYVLTFPTADKTWVYDVATQMWHKWLSIDSEDVFHRHRSNCSAIFQGINVVGDYQNGIIYQLSNTTYTDNGATIRRVRRAPHLTADLQRIFHDEFQIQFQPGVGLITGQGSIPQAMLRWSNDGGSTWSNEHWKSIGAIGHYKHRIIWRQLGWSRDRIYEVVVTDPVKAVIISANLKAGSGDN